MVSLLLPVIYLAFISLGLPDSLLGSAWPVMYQELGTSVSSAGIISMIIAAGTIVSSLNSDRLNTRFGTEVCRCLVNDGRINRRTAKPDQDQANKQKGIAKRQQHQNRADCDHSLSEPDHFLVI